MGKRVKCNLKEILDERKGYSIRQLASDIGTNFENVRRMYHDETIKYDRVLIANICDKLNIGVDELLIIIDVEEDSK